jgi:hypothetical protein
MTESLTPAAAAISEIVVFLPLWERTATATLIMCCFLSAEAMHLLIYLSEIRIFLTIK